MKTASAKILNSNPTARNVAASAARMSTQAGTALEIYDRSGDPEKDLKLIQKVLASGHKSVIEHQTLSVAFNDVSVMVEQFIIEFRLASYTVKSRRYVDFSDAGFVVPASLNDEQAALYRSRMEKLFADYGKLMELGVPKEDARFLLPYCLRSNFFMTINAREMIHMIASMIRGRGARYEELRMLGLQLRDQFEELYPGVIDVECAKYCAGESALPTEFSVGEVRKGGAKLIGMPADQEGLLSAALSFSGRGEAVSKETVRALLQDMRPRELEMLCYTFRITDISLACLTHFTRHRMQSPVIPNVVKALCSGNYVLPESVAVNAEATEIYKAAFAGQAEFARELLGSGAAPEAMVYCAMSGHVMDFLMTINARELLHFAKLRTCTRAQWEIRGVDREMLVRLNEVFPVLFENYGPSCAVTGKCPEGKMTCGHPVKIVNGEWTY